MEKLKTVKYIIVGFLFVIYVPPNKLRQPIAPMRLKKMDRINCNKCGRSVDLLASHSTQEGFDAYHMGDPTAAMYCSEHCLWEDED